LARGRLRPERSITRWPRVARYGGRIGGKSAVVSPYRHSAASRQTTSFRVRAPTWSNSATSASPACRRASVLMSARLLVEDVVALSYRIARAVLAADEERVVRRCLGVDAVAGERLLEPVTQGLRIGA
jgi:hypothetical protein